VKVLFNFILKKFSVTNGKTTLIGFNNRIYLQENIKAISAPNFTHEELEKISGRSSRIDLHG